MNRLPDGESLFRRAVLLVVVVQPEGEDVESQENYTKSVEQKVYNFFLALHFLQVLVADLHVHVDVRGLVADALQLLVLLVQI